MWSNCHCGLNGDCPWQYLLLAPTYDGAMQFSDNADETTEYEYDAN